MGSITSSRDDKSKQTRWAWKITHTETGTKRVLVKQEESRSDRSRKT